MIRRAVRDSTRGHFDMVTAAPRDFNPAFVRFGSFASDRYATPGSRGMSALLLKADIGRGP